MVKSITTFKTEVCLTINGTDGSESYWNFCNTHCKNGMLCLIPILFTIQKTRSTFSFIWHVNHHNRLGISQTFLYANFSRRNSSQIKFFPSCPRNYVIIFAVLFSLLTIGIGKYRITKEKIIAQNIQHDIYLSISQTSNVTPRASSTGIISIENTAMSNRTTTRSFLSLLNSV